jgi:hypothetical protein
MSNENEVQHVEVAAVETNALEALERANIDTQVATAHRYPRSISKFIEKATELVSVDMETAESCIYRRPVGKDDGNSQKFVEGESIRLAEIVAATYGNLRVGVIITEMTPRYVKAMGVAHDLESNYASKAEVVESTVTKKNEPFSERMRLVVAKAAQSKARRDAIFAVIPKSLCKPIIKAAKQMIAGNERPLIERRQAVALWLTKLSIPAERVFTVLGVKGVEELGDEHLEVLTGLRTALKEGDITLDEAFPPIKFDDKSKTTSAEKSQKTGLEKVNVNFDNQDGQKLIDKIERLPGETDPVFEARKREQIKALQDAENKDKGGSQNNTPPAEPRYYCQHCEIDHEKLTDNGLCPKCLTNDKIIDRKEYYCAACDKDMPAQKKGLCPKCKGKLVKQTAKPNADSKTNPDWAK